MQSTYVPKLGELQRRWFVVDATDVVLGRLCTEIANRLSGKVKPQYTPHLDTGDHVVVINAGNVKLTGDKATGKVYYRHSGYPGGIKAESAGSLMKRKPERVIMAGVRGMLPKTKLGRQMIKKLRVYSGSEHPHAAQQPVPLELPVRTPSGDKK